MSPMIDLRVCGPSERDWATVCDVLPTFVWPQCRRVVVVSPHPDDETFGAGGLIAVALQRGLQVLIVSVTDGEAASSLPDLACIRRTELSSAMDCLDPTCSIETLRLGFADSQVAASLTAVTEDIARCLDPDDLVVCPLPDDGHPDHDSVSVAATDAANAIGATIRWFPVWAWHCHDPASSMLARAERLALPPGVLARKQRAVACYVSQIEGDTPVVPPMMLVRLLRPFETFVVPACG